MGPVQELGEVVVDGWIGGSCLDERLHKLRGAVRALPVRRDNEMFLEIARRHRRALAVIAMLAVVDAALALAQPWPLKLVVDNAIGGRPFPSSLTRIDPLTTAGRTVVAIGLSVVLVGVGAAVTYLLATHASATSEQIGDELRTALVQRLLALDAAFHDEHHSGELASRLTSDVARVEEAVVSISSVVVPESLMLIGIVVMLLRIDAYLALAALLVVPALWAVTVRRRRAVRAAERASRDAAGRLSANGADVVRQVRLAQLFGQQRQVMRRYGHQSRRVVERSVAAARVEARYRPVADLLVACVAGLCLALGVARVASGRMTVGTLLVLLAYVSRVFGPVRSLSSLVTSLARASASRDRLLDVLRARPLVVDGDLSGSDDGVEEGADADADAGPTVRWPCDIELEKVTFGYRAGEPVLRNVSVCIPSGAFVAVVGPSGAGKSTLVQLILRAFDPVSGSVTFGGIDVRSFRMSSVLRRIAYVPQDSQLIEGTIAANIAFGRAGATFHDVRRAASRSGAHAFIAALPRGYDTVLGENGTRLSGGERRRIALARAVVRDAPVLLLDEPTSGLDAVSEAAVLDALEELRVGRTVVAVSHHLTLAMRADVVVVLDGGVVAEVGPPHALACGDGPFSRLCAAAQGRPQEQNQQHQTQGEHDDEQVKDEWVLGSVLRREREWRGQERPAQERPGQERRGQERRRQERQVTGRRGGRLVGTPPAAGRTDLLP